MLIRFWHAKTTNRMRNIGNFGVLGPIELHDATKKLYDFIITSKGLCDELTILQYAHPLMVVLLQTKIFTGDPIGCATDQALFLASLRSNGRFQLANSHTKCCAMFQHSFYAICIHDAHIEWESLLLYMPIRCRPPSVQKPEFVLGGVRKQVHGDDQTSGSDSDSDDSEDDDMSREDGMDSATDSEDSDESSADGEEEDEHALSLNPEELAIKDVVNLELDNIDSEEDHISLPCADESQGENHEGGMRSVQGD
jgi:Nucleosome binding factor SPN, SPT16 subunit